MLKTYDDVLNFISKHDIHYINFCFVEHGKRKVITKSAQGLAKDSEPTLMVRDYASHSGPVALHPDWSTTHKDLHCAYPALAVMCDIAERDGSRCQYDPRAVLKAAAESLYSSGHLDLLTCRMGLRFFVFDDVTYANEAIHSRYTVSMDEGSAAANKQKEYGNHGHRLDDYSSALYASQPEDSLFDLRTEIFANLVKSGVRVDAHMHGDGPGQCELRLDAYPLTEAGDILMMAKNIIKGTVLSYGKSATFMPQPLKGITGSGLSLTLELKKNNIALARDADTVKYFIYGILKNIRAVTAFTSATTNSYKRLLHCGPMGSYYAENDTRAALGPCRRSGIMYRLMDAAGDPYLALAAIAMAGLDGIEHRAVETSNHVPMTLREALAAVSVHHDFLLHDAVFSPSIIEDYLELKREEVLALYSSPCPTEFKNYYSA